MTEALLSVEDLGVEFHTDDGIVKAVDGVSFSLEAGQTLGIVGESGSGKSVTNLAMLGLIPQPPGRITRGCVLYRGQDLLQMPPRALRRIRGRQIAMIFQDPMTCLNPFLPVGEQLAEVTRQHLGHGRRQAWNHAVAMLERVGISDAAGRAGDYPHQFSGGMRQRVMIAMAVSCQPDILIADEPTTALDVTIQAQILELMTEMQSQLGTAIILITHDLGVIAGTCHRVNVMYAGKIVEQAGVDALFARPRHPYTLGLLRSLPRLDEHPGQRLLPIAGQPPDLARLPAGCAFEPRCPYSIQRCRQDEPPLVGVEPLHDFACFVDVTHTRPRDPAAAGNSPGQGDAP